MSNKYNQTLRFRILCTTYRCFTCIFIEKSDFIVNNCLCDCWVWNIYCRWLFISVLSSKNSQESKCFR